MTIYRYICVDLYLSLSSAEFFFMQFLYMSTGISSIGWKKFSLPVQIFGYLDLIDREIPVMREIN